MRTLSDLNEKFYDDEGLGGLGVGVLLYDADVTNREWILPTTDPYEANDFGTVGYSRISSLKSEEAEKRCSREQKQSI